MNFKKLQEMQRALDNAILAEKPKMSAEELFTKTSVALSVELAEVANCSEHFKHWKINKGKFDGMKFINTIDFMFEDKVRNDDRKHSLLANTEGLLVDSSKKHNLDTFELLTKEQAHHLTLVEEAADCLHFILSLANQSSEELEVDADVMLKAQLCSKEQDYLDLIWVIGNMWETNIFNLNLIDFTLSYFDKLGITTVELEQAYYDKNEVNYQRLRDGY